VEQVLAARLEARCPVRHDAFALGGSDLAAQIGLAGDTEFAFFAFGGAVRSRLLVSGWFPRHGEGRRPLTKERPHSHRA
jgi:hypothetical protein